MSDKFGLCHLKKEGAPIHPDDVYIIDDINDASAFNKWYERQLKAYNDYFGFNQNQECR